VKEITNKNIINYSRMRLSGFGKNPFSINAIIPNNAPQE